MDLKKLSMLVVGMALFAWILANADLNRIFSIISSLDLKWFLAAVTVNCIAILLKAGKWKILINQKYNINFLETLEFFLIGFFFSTITPGRIGDFTRAKYIAKKTGLAFATISVIVDRVIDIVLLLTFGFVSMLIGAEYLGLAFSPGVMLFLLLITLLLVIGASNRELTYFFLKPIHNNFVPEKFRQKTSKGFKNVFAAIKTFKGNKTRLAKAVLMGFGVWLATITMVYFLSLSLDFSLPFYVFFIITPIIALSDIIPLSIGGLGPRDLITINLLSVFSVGYNEALAFSILYFFSGYFLIAIPGSLIYIKRIFDENRNATTKG